MNTCPPGYFGDTAARRCRRCYKGCETCSGRSPTQCLSCRRGFYHHQEMNTCVTFCPAGFYADESKCMSVCVEVMSQSLSPSPHPRSGLGSLLLGEFSQGIQHQLRDWVVKIGGKPLLGRTAELKSGFKFGQKVFSPPKTQRSLLASVNWAQKKRVSLGGPFYR